MRRRNGLTLRSFIGSALLVALMGCGISTQEGEVNQDASWVPPAPSLTSSPSPITNSTSATFAFVASGASGYVCSRDGAAFAACTSPASYSALAVGSHTFSVKAQNRRGLEGPATTFSWTIDNQPPSAPQGLAIVGTTSTSVSLNWSDAQDSGSGVSGYNVFADGVLFDASDSSDIAVTGLQCGRSYAFGVETFDRAGNLSSRTVLSAMTAGCGVTVVPSIPTGLTATAGDGKVTLGWSANAAAEQVDVYQVYRNDQNLNLNVTGTSFIDTSVTNGTTYTYRISAHNVIGYGNWTATALSATPAAPAPTAVPSIPTGFTATAGDGKVTLSWTANAASQQVDVYQVYRNDQNLNLNVTGTSFIDTSVAGGTTYTYRISAHNVVGYGNWTDPAISATPTGTTPPPASGSPVGFLDNSTPGYWPSNLGSYGVIVTEGPAPTGFNGVNLVYRTSVTCGAGYTNLSEATCINNGWVLLDQNGQMLRNVGYGGVVADPGNAQYRAAFFQASLDRIRLQQEDGMWMDDFGPFLPILTGGPWAAKYPNQASYQAALIAFAQDINARCRAAGIKCGYNTTIPSDDTASQSSAWCRQLGPYADYFTVEGWVAAEGNLPGGVRRAGPEWYNNWDAWRSLHVACNESGTGFLPLNWGVGKVYSLASFLLDWNGKGANVWYANGVAVGHVDPWTPEYGKAATLGAPLGPATKSGNVWTRQFQNGTVTVDPVAGTAAIN